ncbi:MAG: geranyl transferase [Gemmataceae bacterium]|nr:geranyl transferase [Gemmataceae bacterium]
MGFYLEHLNSRLAEGAARLPADLRERHAAYVRGKQLADGGFPGRDDGSDLYYTGFALRSLALLDALTPEVCERTAGFLKSCLTGRASVVDFYSFLYSVALVQLGGGPDVLQGSPADWPQRVAATLAQFRTPDGGYNKNPGAASGSTYHSFLVGLCYEMLGQGLPDPEQVRAFVLGRRRDDGGFVEVGPMRKSGTNPTAAAIGILQLIHGPNLPADDTAATADFLAGMDSMEGGLRANERIPLADLLSTFTGCWTLDQLGALDRVNPRHVYCFAEALQEETGGFKGGIWDEAADVEYTFYGIGTMALVAPASVEA